MIPPPGYPDLPIDPFIPWLSGLGWAGRLAFGEVGGGLGISSDEFASLPRFNQPFVSLAF